MITLATAAYAHHSEVKAYRLKSITTETGQFCGELVRVRGSKGAILFTSMFRGEDERANKGAPRPNPSSECAHQQCPEEGLDGARRRL